MVKNLQIEFKAPATSGVRAEAALDDETYTRIGSEASTNGKSDYEVEAVVTSDDGIVIATTRATYQLRARVR